MTMASPQLTSQVLSGNDDNISKNDKMLTLHKKYLSVSLTN